MGLVPTPEHAWADESIEKAAEMAEQYLDLDRLLAVARETPELTADKIPPTPPLKKGGMKTDPPLEKGGEGGFRPALALRDRHIPQPNEVVIFDRPFSERIKARSGPGGISGNAPPRIGVIRDAAFQFYYPENLEALEAAGAEVVTVSALTDQRLPSLDGLYIGGGFPETQAQALAENQGFRQDVRRLAEDGLPVYAECGGLMYLGESLVLDGVTYPMAGLLPVVFGFSRRPEGHGYTIFEVERPNPYFETGIRVRGHEFHYSKVLSWKGKPQDLAFRMVRGEGFDGKGDGLCYKNTLATYTHIHALGTPSWAEKMVEAAVLYQKK